ncbi:hypothetical protein [Pseudoalteromonas sp. T1lg88]|uniref:hypothetical protein n=1 Tax=Pseudoalteromonas sp. T1lg88 TaxID=2077104 RepID=UPI000CF6D929|nr:hypothetical protein [Pseudoalteromonas sp. T1lg88]
MKYISKIGAMLFVVTSGASMQGMATEPCGDFGECLALIEINASDGDIGFHFLFDGDDLESARLTDPDGAKLFEYKVGGSLKEQTLTETFAESAEPLCWNDPEAEEDEEIVTLSEFLERWQPGIYMVTGKGEEGEKAEGETMLTYHLPAAPANVSYNGGVITWEPGNDLGKCATSGELDDLVNDGSLPMHPEFVAVGAWEVVMDTVVEDGDPLAKMKFSVRVPASAFQVAVSQEFLDALPANTEMKIEVGAIGVDGNATFTETGDICVNEIEEGCE